MVLGPHHSSLGGEIDFVKQLWVTQEFAQIGMLAASDEKGKVVWD